MGTYSRAMLLGQIHNFPEGQFVAEYEGAIVGYCATFLIDGDIALQPHTWNEITGGGYASRHDPNGDYLYGMEVCVDPDYRGLRLGQRLYDERKKLARSWDVKGIVFGGRIPSLAKRLRRYGTPEAYLEEVKANRLRDPVLTFQMRNGFEVLGLLPRYLPEDKESEGYAVHLVWRNPAGPKRPRRHAHAVAGRLYQQRAFAHSALCREPCA